MNTKDLGILVGLLLTDGCVAKPRTIVFHNKSEVMHDLFQDHATKLFGNIHFSKGIQKNGTKITLISNKKIVNELLKSCNLKTFRRKQYENGTFPKMKLPTFIKNLPESSKLNFLQTVFTADGSISVSIRWHKRNKNWEIRRRIELSCKHPRLRKDFYEIIENLGFNPRTSCDNITLERKEDILRFAKLVRFVPKVKVGGDSKSWKGFEKNQILDLAVKTLDFRKKDLENLGTKKDAIDFLRSHISTS